MIKITCVFPVCFGPKNSFFLKYFDQLGAVTIISEFRVPPAVLLLNRSVANEAFVTSYVLPLMSLVARENWPVASAGRLAFEADEPPICKFGCIADFGNCNQQDVE